MLKLALRNCTRNLRRSLLTGFSVFIAVWALVVMISFCEAVINDMCDNAVTYTSGEIRIRKKAYSEHEDVMPLQYYIEDSATIAEKLVKEGLAEAAYPVTRITASAYIGEELKALTIIGAGLQSPFFSKEGAVITAGEVPAAGERSILVPEDLLIHYGLEVGDTLTILSRTAPGGTNAVTCRISGTVMYNTSDLSGDLVVMPIDQLSRLLRMDGSLEILVRCAEAEIEERVEAIRKYLSDDSLEIESWHASSFIYALLPVYDLVYLIIAILFFFIAATLIFNTIMMSVLERKREISTLIALGFERQEIRIQFITEGIIISFAGALLSVLFSIISILILEKTGFDLSLFGADAEMGWGFSRIVYVSIDWFLMLLIPAASIAVAALASVFATRRIGKIEVADALREEA